MMLLSKSLRLAFAGALMLGCAGGTAAASDDWTGFHVGVHAGGGRGDQRNVNIDGSNSFPVGFVRNRDLSGLIGGANLGYDFQIGQLVVGVGGDFSWSNIDSNSTVESPVAQFAGRRNTTKLELEWIATATARLGYVVDDDWLLYVKGGGAWVKGASQGGTFRQSGVQLTTNVSSGTRRGWTIGAGAEWAFNENWSARFEYNYLDFGSKIVTPASTNIASGVTTVRRRDSERDLHLVKVGISFRFGGDNGNGE